MAAAAREARVAVRAAVALRPLAGHGLGMMGSRHLAERGAFAAIDLGTTNCRLLVAVPCGFGQFRVVDSFSRIVRLGEGLDATGRLSDAAIDRALRALDICAGRLQQWQVTSCRAVATEACRKAVNGTGFVAAVRERTGIGLEIISSAEEARLVLEGCRPLLSARPGGAIVFDIGGGSTEILWLGVETGNDGRMATSLRGVVSLPHGVVSLTERFGGSRPDGEIFASMVALVQEKLLEFDRTHQIRVGLDRGHVQMLGSSGTVTTLAAIDRGLPRYDRTRVDGVALELPAIRRICDMLVEAGLAGRSAHPCIGPGRADLMIAGCAILKAICEVWPVPRLRVADRGVREGILADLAQRCRKVEATTSPDPVLPLASQGA
jgi:exopolyphosphatase/guanosine-5'-triphosphate,3'-diphosphate pyrophosphatase